MDESEKIKWEGKKREATMPAAMACPKTKFVSQTTLQSCLLRALSEISSVGGGEAACINHSSMEGELIVECKDNEALLRKRRMSRR